MREELCGGGISPVAGEPLGLEPESVAVRGEPETWCLSLAMVTAMQVAMKVVGIAGGRQDRTRNRVREGSKRETELTCDVLSRHLYATSWLLANLPGDARCSSRLTSLRGQVTVSGSPLRLPAIGFSFWFAPRGFSEPGRRTSLI